MDQNNSRAVAHWPLAGLLDAEQDGLTLSGFQTFDIGALMNMGERNLVPVLLYLFRRIESASPVR